MHYKGVSSTPVPRVSVGRLLVGDLPLLESVFSQCCSSDRRDIRAIKISCNLSSPNVQFWGSGPAGVTKKLKPDKQVCLYS